MRKLIASVAASLFIASTAHADVLYQWQPTDKTPPYGITLKIQFTDAAVAAGSYTLDTTAYSTVPYTGLVSFFYSHPDTSNPIELHQGLFLDPTHERVRLSFQFLGDGTLTGNIDALNFDSNITLASDASGLFTILHANSDAGMVSSGCTHWVDCVGATGTFVSSEVAGPVSPPTNVPEPGSLALVGLGMVGIGRLMRRQAKR